MKKKEINVKQFPASCFYFCQGAEGNNSNIGKLDTLSIIPTDLTNFTYLPKLQQAGEMKKKIATKGVVAPVSVVPPIQFQKIIPKSGLGTESSITSLVEIKKQKEWLPKS
jgi:hypothetical protein